jgi:hypothetical protein
MGLKVIGREVGLSDSGYGPMAGSCEHGTELRGSPFIGR